MNLSTNKLRCRGEWPSSLVKSMYNINLEMWSVRKSWQTEENVNKV